MTLRSRSFLPLLLASATVAAGAAFDAALLDYKLSEIVLFKRDGELVDLSWSERAFEGRAGLQRVWTLSVRGKDDTSNEGKEKCP